MEDQGEQALKLGMGVGSALGLTTLTVLQDVIETLPERLADFLTVPFSAAAAGAVIGGFVAAARLPATPKVYTPTNATRMAATCLTCSAIFFDATAGVQLAKSAIEYVGQTQTSALADQPHRLTFTAHKAG